MSSINATAAHPATTAFSPSLYVVDPEPGFILLSRCPKQLSDSQQATQLALDAAALQLRLVVLNGHCQDVPSARRVLREAFEVALNVGSRVADIPVRQARAMVPVLGALFVDGHIVWVQREDATLHRIRANGPPQAFPGSRLQLIGRAADERQLSSLHEGSDPLFACDAFALCTDPLPIEPGVSDIVSLVNRTIRVELASQPELRISARELAGGGSLVIVESTTPGALHDRWKRGTVASQR